MPGLDAREINPLVPRGKRIGVWGRKVLRNQDAFLSDPLRTFMFLFSTLILPLHILKSGVYDV